jgi:uncharacterized spore protein YtfJ
LVGGGGGSRSSNFNGPGGGGGGGSSYIEPRAAHVKNEEGAKASGNGQVVYRLGLVVNRVLRRNGFDSIDRW